MTNPIKGENCKHRSVGYKRSSLEVKDASTAVLRRVLATANRADRRAIEKELARRGEAS